MVRRAARGGVQPPWPRGANRARIAVLFDFSGGFGGEGRKPNDDAGAPLVTAAAQRFDLQRPAMSLRDLLDDSQSETRAIARRSLDALEPLGAPPVRGSANTRSGALAAQWR